MLESLRNKKILVVVAHPDDELLGLGGTLNRLVHDFNAQVRVVILGEGITSRADKRDPEAQKAELETHRGNIESAQKLIGYQELAVYSFPDNRFDSVDLLDIIKCIEKEKTDFSPEVIFTHHGGDVNIDHQRTFEAVVTASRPMSHESVKSIICFETPSGTEWRVPSDPRHFHPNMFIELKASNLEAKIKGMECYKYEKRDFPHPRSPKALEIHAQNWGISVGLPMAEAFFIARSIG